MFSSRSFVLLLFLFALALSGRAQDGLFADFVTSQGNFTCELYYDRAPKTVANFAGLATGEQPWLDLATGAVRRQPFYNGIIFHRVIKGFVIQGGSPNGQGTDGPGYSFPDEFHSTLRHTAAGFLSMANSGIHSNGSQFFVTLGATAHLDNKHSIFGKVVAGMEVVNAIGDTPTGTGDRPLTPVVIQSVSIRRVGAAAEAFLLSAQRLPRVGGADPRLVQEGANRLLTFGTIANADYRLFRSDNLLTWTAINYGFFAAPPVGRIDVTSLAQGKTQQFYRVPVIAYPDIFAPARLAGKRLVFTFTAGNFAGSNTLEMTFNADGTTGAIRAGSTTGTVSAYNWKPQTSAATPYAAFLAFLSSNEPQCDLYPYFTSATGGTFTGVKYSSPSQSLSGTFTIGEVASATTTGRQQVRRQINRTRRTR
ncbi:MAG TPA: peptidylprolyl isomerase [Chthoniobacteraceae bacterium]|jgi:peptidyl-prolyl cis-trans isomerase A (cyclophilin A)